MSGDMATKAHDGGSPERGEASAMIDAYLDGTMTPADRATFERSASLDPRLKDELDLQARIDERLRALMSVPEASPDEVHIGSGSAGPIDLKMARRRRLVPGWVRVAAALALCGAGIWLFTAGPLKLITPESAVAADVVLSRFEKSGFEPLWACETDEQFVSYTREKLGVAFVVKPQPNLQLVGWSYADGVLGDSAPVLLARHEGQPIMVVMDRARNDHRVRVAEQSGLKVHRAELGRVVLYEISPSCAPVVVNNLIAK